MSENPKYQSICTIVGYLRQVEELWTLTTIDNQQIPCHGVKPILLQKMNEQPELKSAPLPWRCHLKTGAEGNVKLFPISFDFKDSEERAIVSGKVKFFNDEKIVLEIKPNDSRQRDFKPFLATLAGTIEGVGLGDIWRCECAIADGQLRVKNGELVRKYVAKEKLKPRTKKQIADRESAPKPVKKGEAIA